MTEIILHCLLQMWKGLVPLDSGLFILNMKLFLLSLAHKGLPPPSLFKDLLPPPGTPSPARKAATEGIRARREALAQPPHRPRYEPDDDDENKENLPPEDDRKGYGRSIVESLLQRLEEDLIQYQEEVLRELSGLRQKLGIPQ
uniref:E4 protein n=1 Tax=Human papillomavirus TaxID=10566 RepID=A0A385PR42_9PAPI|nr:MAG: E4 protein [Human papillomavirus]